MAPENVAVGLSVADAANSGDVQAFVACLHPDVIWEESTDGYPGLRKVYHGRAETREWFEEALLEFWETFHGKVEESAEVGDDCVLQQVFMIARGKTSGVETEVRLWQLFWIADGMVAKRQVFFNKEEALEAAGLSA